MTDQNVEAIWFWQAQLKQKQQGRQQYWREVKTGGGSASHAITWLFLRVGKAIIPYLKEESLAD